MLNIDKNIFEKNLKWTQAYCDLQIKKGIKDNAKILRSYNPLYNEKDLFSFKTEHFSFEIEPNIKHCTLTKWLFEPTDRESIIDNLFIDQLNFKKEFQTVFDNNKKFLGRILVSQIDCSILDGASEVQSLGLIDIYDIPPIDTWFYLIKANLSRLLFAWIPSELVHYANQAVEVNCIDCINWADIWFPQEFVNT